MNEATKQSKSKFSSKGSHQEIMLWEITFYLSCQMA